MRTPWRVAAALGTCAAMAVGGCGYLQAAAAWYLVTDAEKDDPAPPPSGPGGANAVPGVSVLTPSGNQGLAVALTYLLVDAEGDVADVQVQHEFSTDGGASWSPLAAATERTGAPSEGTLGLATSGAGTSHVFVWDAFADVGGVNGLARLTVTPADPGPPLRVGTPGSTSVLGFPVLNRVIATVAGTPGGTLAFPGSVARDGAGNLFVADTFNHRVHVLNTQTGAITVGGVTVAPGTLGAVAGTGAAGFNGDNQVASGAQLSFPSGVALDGSGHLFIADTLNHRVRRVDRLTGFITTVAGTGQPGTAGDGSLATAAQLDGPRAVAFDAAGNLHVSDTNNHAVRVLNLQSTAITIPPGGTGGVTVNPNALQTWIGSSGNPGATGDGAAAPSCRLRDPWGLAFDGNGHCYVADSQNHAIRAVNLGLAGINIAGVAIAAGNIDRVAGLGAGLGGFAGDGGGGLAAAARLFAPQGIACDGSNNLVLADTGNNRVRVVNTQGSAITLAGVTIPANDINTIAGGGASPGPNDGDGGAASAARLSAPEGVAVLASGDVLIADTGLARVRVVNVGTGTVTVGPVSVGAGQIATVAGTVVSAAALLAPTGVVRSAGLLFVADTATHRVWQVTIATGATAAFAGNGGQGLTGDNGPAASAQLDQPQGLALDANGNLYLADSGNNRVRVVNRQATTQSFHGVSIVAGDIATVVSGSGGPSSLVDSPSIALDGSGNLFICHRGGSRLRKLDTSGVSSTVAGGNTGFVDGAIATARFDGCSGVATDVAGNLLVADTTNHAVRYVNVSASAVTVCGVVIAASSVGTVAGDPPATGPTQGYNGDNQLGTATLLDSPVAVARVTGGHVLIVDAGNQRIRRVDQATGLVTTLAGTGTAGFNGDGLPPVNAHLNGPRDVFLDGATPPNCYFADTGNRRVRRFTP